MTEFTIKPNIGPDAEKDERIASLLAENDKLKAENAKLKLRVLELEKLIFDQKTPQQQGPFDFKQNLFTDRDG